LCLRKWFHGGGEAGAALGGGARRGGGSQKGRRPHCFHPKEEEGSGGQVGRLGQAGCEARWARVVSVWAGRQAKDQGGGGHEEVGPEGRARLAGPNGPKGRKYLCQISSGLCPIRFRKISK
jgi:hypothetical protein